MGTPTSTESSPRATPRGTVFLTGATGYIGGRHHFVFNGMLRGIARSAEDRSICRPPG